MSESIDERNKRVSAELDDALGPLQAQQRDSLVVDLDAAWAEARRRSTPLRFRLGDREYEVQRSRPLRVHLYVVEHCLHELPGGAGFAFEIPEDRLAEYLRVVLGDEFAAAVMASAVDLDTLHRTIIRPVLACWGYVFTAATQAEKKTEPTPG